MPRADDDGRRCAAPLPLMSATLSLSSGSSLDSPTRLATYRLQLHAGFGLDAAAAIVDYLARLGVSHLYTSPYLQAAAGSTHGYDVVDHGRVNTELGGTAAHRRFLAEQGAVGLRQRGGAGGGEERARTLYDYLHGHCRGCCSGRCGGRTPRTTTSPTARSP
jgi:hypothetical protein